LAHLLRAEGVRPGTIVALMVERSFAMMIGILGILRGGKTGARLTNLYGPTEATVDVSYFDCPAGP
jgi:non-ribosomal peptide synthetase component F